MEKALIRHNYSGRNGEKIRYIVVHDTGNPSKGAGARNHFIYFDKPGRNASAHYFVDSKEILQLVEDVNAAWHCGDGRRKFGVTNRNSIGVELCVNSDGDWEMTKKNAIELIKLLLYRHGLRKERVIRHFDASLKLCPGRMALMGWREWTRFYDEI